MYAYFEVGVGSQLIETDIGCVSVVEHCMISILAFLYEYGMRFKSLKWILDTLHVFEMNASRLWSGTGCVCVI